ncbi:nuclease-related domain-containing protein [Salipaludibacillus sp. HK11]|uniref:nuclease-related domain-containing protein n=1 Tax=Salipaludibacillus sp. HK11 TaxID=3394320 RepID=UPI0039FC0F09
MAKVVKRDFDLEDEVNAYEIKQSRIFFERRKVLNEKSKEVWTFAWVGALIGTVILFPIFPLGAIVGGGIGYWIGWTKVTNPHKRRFIELQQEYPNINKVSKGKIGESKVSRAIEKGFGFDYFLINDITLPTNKAGSTQVDHILIGRSRIYCIETKHITGKFYPFSDSQWLWYPTQSRGNVKKKTYMKSPASQSIFHAKHLSNYLKKYIEGIPVQPVVVLTHSGSEWKGKFRDDCYIFNSESEFVTYVNLKESNKKPFLSKRGSERLADHLVELNRRMKKNTRD